MKVTPNSSSNPAALNSTLLPPSLSSPLSSSRSNSARPGAPASGDAASFGAATVGLRARVLAQPEVRSGLVDHFRAQLASGTYHPNPGDVAASMLDDPLTHL